MGKNVLVIDDSSTIQASVKYVLDNNGYTYLMAEDGQKALEQVKSTFDKGEHLSLIICDINMPVMDGLEFLKTLKADDKYKMIPVLMLTTETQINRMHEAKKLGATGYIIKPFHPDKLLDFVKRFAK